MRVDSGRARCGASPVLRTVLCGILGILGLVAGGCGSDVVVYGTVAMTVSNSAQANFSGYLASIVSVTFTRTDGTVVQPIIPSTGEEEVNFSRYTDIVELMGAPAVPTGTYTSATVTLDYTNAAIFVDENGVAIPASILDSSGDAPATISYTITFDQGHPLVVTQYQTVPMDLNFDISASTEIDSVSDGTATVVVRPYMTVSTLPNQNKQIQSRGVFVVANQTPNSFIMNTQPFFDITSQPFGAVTVQVTDQTTYNIDGLNYVGANGLATIAQIPVSTFVIAYGTLSGLDQVTPVLNATQVYAGTTVEGPEEDQITGVVSARSGNNLTLTGALMFEREGIITYYPTLPLTIDSTTIVSVDGQPTANVDTQSISVGQLIDAAGVALPDTGPPFTSLDASGGLVRLQQTSVWGKLNSASSSDASLYVLTLGGFEPPAFHFQGTGTTTANDADPVSYLVKTPANESSTAAGTLFRMDGLVTPYGQAPPDFNAAAVTLGSTTEQTLIIDYINTGAFLPFVTANSGELVVNLSNANIGTVHVVQTGPMAIDLKNPTVDVRIVPDGHLNDQFAIGNDANGIKEYASFSAFVDQITTTFTGSTALEKLVAVGQYDATTSTFTAYRIDLNEM